MSDVLKLENFYLNRLELRLPPDLGENKAKAGQLKLDYDVNQHKDHPNIYRLIFRVIWNPAYRDGKPLSPEMKTEIVGVFSFPEDMPEEKREWLVRFNGALMLYGLLRGQLTAISGAFPTARLILPSFDMRETIFEIEKRKSKPKVKGQTGKPQPDIPKAKGKKVVSKNAKQKKPKP